MSENNTEIFNDELDFSAPNNMLKTLKRLWFSVNDQHKSLTVVLISVVFYTLLSVAAPLYSAYIIDLLWNNIKKTISNGTSFQITWEYGGKDIFFLLLIYLITAFFYTLQSFLMASFAEKLSLRLRTEISIKLNHLPLSYFDKNKTGAILSLATNDLDKMAEALQTGLLKLFTACGMVIGSLIMMFRFNIWLTLIFLFFMGLSLLSTKLFAVKTLKYATQRQQCVSRITVHVEESYSGRVIVKAFNQETNSSKHMHKVTEELAKISKKTDFMINAINPAIRLINRFGQMLIAIFAGKMLLDGTLTVGVFQAFFQYVNQASEPLTEAAYMLNSMQSALASVERIYDMLDETEISADPSSCIVMKESKGNVEFQNVRFGYSSNNILMQNINFIVKPGQKIAIVGSTGAGKTTLINLLMRFYDVNGGKILLDGKDTNTLSRSNLRSNFGMVLQDTWLFEGTIAENIAYGKPDATHEEIISAAKAARVDFFVRTMPHGYDTILNNDTENISIGQRQLLTIARVFLCNPSVLILDEATSSVDTRTEMEIGKAMKSLMKNRTSFVIAHRLSTIIDADLILLMQNGNIIEQGNHYELLKLKGAYADLYYSQFA